MASRPFPRAAPRLRGVSANVTLEPWGSGDLPLLERLLSDPHMTQSPDKLRERQARYERLEGGDPMFKIVDRESGADAGSVGFWTKEWRDADVYEVGWMVVPELQGHGFQSRRPRRRSRLQSATTSTASCMRSRASTTRRRTRSAESSISSYSRHAISSNAKGHVLTCNNWRLDLRV